MTVKGGEKANGHGKAAGSGKEEWDEEIVFEFGGSVGVVSLMILFPSLMLYFCACLLFNQGAMILPQSFEQVGTYLGALAPTPYALQLYVGFCILQLFLAAVMPGPTIYGMPVPSEGNKSLAYLVRHVPWVFRRPSHLPSATASPPGTPRWW